MKKKLLLSLLFMIMLFSISGCGEKKQEQNNQNNNQEENINQEENNKEENNNNNGNIIDDDDEIIEFEDKENEPLKPKTVDSELINCKDCVFAFFKDKKTFGSKVSEYTKDYASLKDQNGYQRRRFLGLILDSSGNIQRAYACGIQSGKAYCLEGTIDGSKFEYNIGILNQVFSSGECEYNINSTRYTCTRQGETNGDTRKDGYVSVHYEENCHVFGKTVEHEAQIYCY